MRSLREITSIFWLAITTVTTIAAAAVVIHPYWLDLAKRWERSHPGCMCEALRAPTLFIITALTKEQDPVG